MRFIGRCVGRILILLLLILGNENVIASGPKILSKESKVYKEVMPIAILLKDAVVNKRVDILSQYSNPDPLYGYGKYLKDINSEEYKYLYDDAWNKGLNPKRRSVYKILSTAKQLEIILEEYKLKEKVYVITYYYDATKIKLKLPLTDKQAELWGIDFVTCRFVRTEEGWKVAYSIFDYGTDYLVNVE